MRPGPGYYEPDGGLFGSKPLGEGVAFPHKVSLRRSDVIKSTFAVSTHPTSSKIVHGVWLHPQLASERKKKERTQNYKSVCSFEKKSPEPKRATGKSMQSTVQNMQYHFRGRQSSGSLRFSCK